MTAYKHISLYFIIFIILPLISYALPIRTYLNDSTESTDSANITFILRSNLTIEEKINHTFEGQSTTDAANWDTNYLASNTTGFLLRFRVDDEAGTTNDRLRLIDCANTNTITDICGPDCGGLDFAQFHNFTTQFNSTSSTAKIFIDGVSRADVSTCTNATQIGSIRFSMASALGTYTVKNNHLLANNKPPILKSNLPNLTWQEDTSTSFNISGNFSDANNDTLTYSLLSPVENITITVNSTTGIVNLTPSPDFFGIRYGIFLANDSDNVTLSNNITLNVTNVNDIPNVTNVLLSNTDSLNRTNGTLIGSWQFSDIDNDAQSANETLWFINGIENTSLRNITTINAANTTKNQNWTFSVRVFDGTSFSLFVNSTSLTIQNSAPTHTIPSITSNDEQNRKNSTLTCTNQSTSDLDEDAVTNFLRWHKNSVLVGTAANSATLNETNSGNFSKNDNLTCEITPYDGTINGSSLNSTAFTILNAAPLLNSSIQNKTLGQDTSTTINISGIFVDIDADNLTYNYTPTSNMIVSINNNTRIAALSPSAGFSGIVNILFFAFDGANSTASNNVTLTVNSVSSSSSSGSSSGGSGGSGGGGVGSGASFVCNMDWKCSEWSVCSDGLQSRQCELVKVSQRAQDTLCPSLSSPPISSRKCEAAEQLKAKAADESCTDNLKNQNEEGIDCGGVCKPCPITQEISDEQEKPSITGQAVRIPKAGNAYLAIAVLLAISSILFYAKFSHKMLFGRKL